MLLNILLLQHTSAACTGCFWCWAIWMFLSGLLGLFIGKWIWGKYANEVAQKNKALKALKDKSGQVEKDFVAAKYQIDELEKDNKGLKASLANFQSEIVTLGTQLSRFRGTQPQGLANTPIPPIQEDAAPLTTQVEDSSSTKESTDKEEVNTDTNSSSLVESNQLLSQEEPAEKVEQAITSITTPIPNQLAYYGEILKTNNLKIMEGVGPKIEDILNKEGYKTWSDIANSKVDDLKNIMHDAGPRYRIHNPATWNRQAKMAIKGDWQNLIDLQKILSSKRTGEEIEKSIPKIEKLVAEKFGFEIILSSDLKIVEGIGSKIEELLKENGISNWEVLAEKSVASIQNLLIDSGEQYKLADPTTWPSQANLANQKEWAKLKAFQDELKGRKVF